MKVRIDRMYKKEAKMDTVSDIIPIDFGEECRTDIQTVPFEMHLPNAITVSFVAFGHGYLEKS